MHLCTLPPPLQGPGDSDEDKPCNWVLHTDIIILDSGHAGFNMQVRFIVCVCV